MDRPVAIRRLVALLRQQEERADDVGRLLHSQVGPTLSAIAFHLQALGAPPETEREIRGYLAEALAHVREASMTLHGNVVERTGLPMALERLIESRRTGAKAEIQFRLRVEKRYPATIGNAVYQITELALDNALRHSGARRIDVRLNAGPSSLSAEISDKGSGFDLEAVSAQPPGIGLILMESYAERARLKLRIASAPGKGTIIRIKTS